MKKYHEQRGFTLIEIIVVIVLLGILVTGSTNMIYVGFNSFFSKKNIINANWQASVALERMTRDLQAVCSTSDITTANASTIALTDINGSSITYQVSGNQLQRNGQVIADGIQSISFNYYRGDATLTELTPPVTTSYIRYIVITLNVSYKNVTFPVTTGIYLWNLK